MATEVSTVKVGADPNSAEEVAARKARYQQLRAKLGRSKLEVKGLKGIHYFWADNVRDQGELIRLDIAGYSIVREENVKEVLEGKVKPKVVANGLREDGTYVMGDVILMQCPEEVYEFIQLSHAQDLDDLTRSATEGFEQEAERNAVPTFRVAVPQAR